MRVAILTESPADDAALRVLVDAVLGCQTEAVVPTLRSREGWPSVYRLLSGSIFSLHHYSDAYGLVVAADGNRTSLQESSPKNRLRALQAMVDKTVASLGRVPGRPRLRVAIGVASPALEAWLLCHRVQEISEAAWEKGLRDQTEPYSKLELKKHLYGSDRPTLPLETEKMVEAARELCGRISLLEQRFPIGFGTLARQLREWRQVAS
jgi:hypothetical protein